MGDWAPREMICRIINNKRSMFYFYNSDLCNANKSMNFSGDITKRHEKAEQKSEEYEPSKLIYDQIQDRSKNVNRQYPIPLTEIDADNSTFNQAERLSILCNLCKNNVIF